MFSLTTASLFFGGIAAAAVPVLLHLLMQGKPKVIEFPAVMFLLQKIETHRRNYRLKHILLLFMRILLFILLGLALARPTLKLGWLYALTGGNDGFVSQLVTSLGSQDAPIAAAIVIDTSLRMNYTAENKTRLEEAQEFARWILRRIPRNSRVALLSCEPASPVFQVDILAAENKIDRLQITPLGRPIAEIVQGAAALLTESDSEHRELYVLTDLSIPGWDVSISPESLRRYDGELFIVDVGTLEPKNSSLRKFTLIPETPIAPAQIRFDVDVAHTGQATTKAVELVLFGSVRDPNAETVRMSKTVNFPDGESSQSVPFILPTGMEPGTHQGKFRFSTSDALPMDDQCWFTLSVQPPQKVLLFAQPPVSDSTIFLRHALDPPFAVESRPITELAGMAPTELQEYRAVVLLDPPPLLPGTWKRLSEYAALGFGVGIFLGESVALLSFNDPAATEVLGAKLERQAKSPEGVWLVPGVSPVFSSFRSLDPDLSNFPWEALPVFRYWELGELSSRADIAARYSDTRPAIITQTIGRGCTVMVTTPVSQTENTSWNDLPRGEAQWMFLPFAEGIVRHLVGLGNQKFNFTVGEPVVLRPNITTFPTSCLLGTPHKPPRESPERLTPDPIRREIVIPKTTEPGNYSVRSGGEGAMALNLGFSVNIAAEETRLQRVDTATLDRHFGADAYQVVRTPQEIEFGIARKRVGQEIYEAVMLLLACIFAVEYIFANRIYKRS